MINVIARGRVQGVGYRAFVEHEALKAGIEGWVRNCSDGSVEAVFVGSEEMVKEVIEACRRGPFAARVDGLDERTANPEDLAFVRPGERFSILATR